MRPSCKRMPTKLCMMVEAGADHPGAPALSFQFSAMGRGQPENHLAESSFKLCQTKPKLSVFHSMSLHCLHSFRNLLGENHFDFFSDLVIIPFLSGLAEVFFHIRIRNDCSELPSVSVLCVCVCVYICVNMFLCLCLCLSAYQHICVFVFFTSSLQHTLSVSCN